jgi:hypothetical protein
VRYCWLLLTLSAIVSARAGLHPRQSLAVAVFDYAALPDSVLRPAVETATEAFRAAGIDTVWTICRLPQSLESCSRALPPLGQYVEMLVMREPKSAADHERAGFAVPGRPRAYAFYATAAAIADRDLRPVSLVLGFILIHEIGHVLGLSHQSQHGAMAPYLNAHDMDSVALGRPFDERERKQLRASLATLR